MNRYGLGLGLALVLLCAGMSPAFGAARNTEEKVRCLKLKARIDDIHLRQRMGYTAKQGRLYKQKLSTLEAEHRARCR